jgi:hypothetical protein
MDTPQMKEDGIDSTQDSRTFMSHDFKLGYFYETRNRFELYVYKSRTQSIDKPIFGTPVPIHSAFHSSDEKYFVINYGSSSYGTVAAVYQGNINPLVQHISEREYRHLVEKGLQLSNPEIADRSVLHLYAPIREITNGEALLYAGGDFIHSSGEVRRQKRFDGVFLGIHLERKSVRLIDRAKGLKSWYRGRYESPSAFGSGFFVTPRLIVSNAHVVEKSSSVLIRLSNREAWGEVIKVSERFDLALIEIDENSLEGSPISIGDNTRLGQKIRVFGFPLPMFQGFTLKVTEGIVSGLLGLSDDPLSFQITAPIQPGNSGGPILDDKSRLIGVAVASLDKLFVAKATGSLPENVNLGIHLDVISEFLHDANASIQTKESDEFFDPEKSCVQIVRALPFP